MARRAWSIDFDDRESGASAHRDRHEAAPRRIVLPIVELPLLDGMGRNSIWLHQAIPLQFVFFGGREPTLNRAWVDALMAKANSTSGLEVVAEPEPNPEGARQ